MATEKQIQSNRANAMKSTGPRTEGGKNRSRANSWKHGLTAELLVIGGEEADDFHDLRATLIDAHDPQSPLERELVERLAGIFWRLRRLPFFEAAVIDARQAQLDDEARMYDFKRPYMTPEQFSGDGDEIEAMPSADWSIYVGSALIRDGIFGDALGKLSRYEAGLMKTLAKTLLLLQECRDATRQPVLLQAVALPAAA